MDNLTVFFGIMVTVTLGAISPGASFVMVARTAIAKSREDGLAAALGMGTGAGLFAAAALLGLQGLLTAFPAVYQVIRLLGSLYLAYLGVMIWRAATHAVSMVAPEHETGQTRLWRSYLLGLTTQLTNPITALVLASIFAAFMPEHSTIGFQAALCGLVFTIDGGWYSIVALVLSSELPRNAYLRHQAVIDRASGAVIVALALKLMVSVIFS